MSSASLVPVIKGLSNKWRNLQTALKYDREKYIYTFLFFVVGFIFSVYFKSKWSIWNLNLLPSKSIRKGRKERGGNKKEKKQPLQINESMLKIKKHCLRVKATVCKSGYSVMNRLKSMAEACAWRLINIWTFTWI